MRSPPCTDTGRVRALTAQLAVVIAVCLGAACPALAQKAAPGRDQAAAPRCPPEATMPTAQQIQQAQRQAKDRGFLWRISKDGRNSYLYGSLHVGKLDWVFPGAKLREALAQSDVLALELDPTDPAIQQDIARALLVPSQPLAEDLRARLAKQLAAACIPESAMKQMHPVMQVVSLSVLLAKWEGLDAAFGTEPALANQAKAAGKRVVSLETAKRQIEALIPADAADQEPELIRSGLEQLEKDQVRPVLRRMVRAWEQGKLSDFENYATWCECLNTAADRALYERINDQRNPGLAQSIEGLHRNGSAVFAAVGALHMTGPASLPKLLAGLGFKVERVPL